MLPRPRRIKWQFGREIAVYRYCLCTWKDSLILGLGTSNWILVSRSFKCVKTHKSKLFSDLWLKGCVRHFTRIIFLEQSFTEKLLKNHFSRLTSFRLPLQPPSHRHRKANTWKGFLFCGARTVGGLMKNGARWHRPEPLCTMPVCPLASLNQELGKYSASVQLDEFGSVKPCSGSPLYIHPAHFRLQH